MDFLFIIKHLHYPVDKSVDKFLTRCKIGIQPDGIFIFSVRMIHLCIYT